MNTAPTDGTSVRLKGTSEKFGSWELEETWWEEAGREEPAGWYHLPKGSSWDHKPDGWMPLTPVLTENTMKRPTINLPDNYTLADIPRLAAEMATQELAPIRGGDPEYWQQLEDAYVRDRAIVKDRRRVEDALRERRKAFERREAKTIKLSPPDYTELPPSQEKS